jgi:hypothetical protein
MANKLRHWTDPHFSIQIADHCATIEVSAADGEWVSFLAAGSKNVAILRGIDQNRALAYLNNDSSFTREVTLAARALSYHDARWKNGMAEVEVFCHGAFRTADRDKVLLLIGRSASPANLAETVGNVAMRTAHDLNAKLLDELQSAEAEREIRRRQSEQIEAELRERGIKFSDLYGKVVDEPRLTVPKELTDALPVSTYVNDMLNPAKGTQSATRQIIASGYLPERSGSYTAIASLRGVSSKKYLLTWQPWEGKPSYPEVRAAVAKALPRALEIPLRSELGRTDFRGEYLTEGLAQPDLSQGSDIWDALSDTHLDDRDMKDRIDKVRGALDAHGFEALAWYQGHHFWSEETWGIYIDAPRLDDFALSLWDDMRTRKCSVSMQQAAFLAIGLVLSHERFHARVEAASCWQELSSLSPSHKRYAERVYKVQKGTAAWLEEALANWAAWNWFQTHGLTSLSNGQPVDPKSLDLAVEATLDLSPAGYREWRLGHQPNTWRSFTAQLCKANPAANPLPLESIIQGPLLYDLRDEDIPVRFIGGGSIASSLLAHPASFNVPSRREMERALRHLGHVLDSSGGKGGHQKWTAPDQRAFILPTKDPVSRTVFKSFLAHIGMDKSGYVRELRPSI